MNIEKHYVNAVAALSLVCLVVLVLFFNQNIYSQELEKSSSKYKGYITPEIVGEISNLYTISFYPELSSNNHSAIFYPLIRELSVKNICISEEMINSNLPNKIQQLLVQTENSLCLGFFDAALKASWAQQYGLTSDKFWASDGAYGRTNQLLQTLSAIDYSFNQSDNVWEFIRFFLGQAALSSVEEHLGYWLYINSGIPVVKNGDLMGWRGVAYPRDHHGNNDVGWMENTPSGWTSRIVFKDPPGTVRKEAVFLTLPFLYIFSYVITPNKKFVQPNKFTKLRCVVYTDGVDYNKVTGFYGIKMGLRYTLPESFSLINKRTSLFFYSSHDLNARGRFEIAGGGFLW